MKILPFRPFRAAVAEYTRHPSSKRIDAGENPAGSAMFLPGSVKVARRSVKPFGVGASPTLAANFWKAGRYKLAAPVSKTGSAYRGDWSVTSAFRQFNHQPNHNHDHQPILAEVAGEEIRQTTAQTGHAGGVEATTIAANPA